MQKWGILLFGKREEKQNNNLNIKLTSLCNNHVKGILKHWTSCVKKKILDQFGYISEQLLADKEILKIFYNNYEFDKQWFLYK
jgi:hypothetical protein